MRERHLLILMAVLLGGAVLYFMLHVPILPAIGIFVVVVALAAMFGLGFYFGDTPDAADDLVAKIRSSFKHGAIFTHKNEPGPVRERNVDTIRLTDEISMHR